MASSYSSITLTQTLSAMRWGLPETNGDILELGPREVLLPKVKPRREAPTSHRGVFMRSSLLPAVLSLARSTLSLVSRPGYVSIPRGIRGAPAPARHRVLRRAGTRWHLALT
jgi:hypothetical protein